MTEPANGAAYTKLPNAIIDMLPELGDAELRVLLVIVRKTAGWQKECDIISVSQLEDATGLTRRNAHTALRSLVEKGWIKQERAGKQSFCYSVNPYPLGAQFDRIPNDTSSLRDTEPLPVGIRSKVKPYPLGITQKKESKETSSTTIGGAGDFTKTLIRDYNISPKKAQEIAGAGADPETVYQSIRNCVDPKDTNSMGRFINRLIAAPPEKGKPYPGPFGKPAQNGTGPPGYKPPADALSPEERDKKLKELTRR